MGPVASQAQGVVYVTRSHHGPGRAATPTPPPLDLEPAECHHQGHKGVSDMLGGRIAEIGKFLDFWDFKDFWEQLDRNIGNFEFLIS